jgi:cytoskeleton protein RodZ
MSDVTPSSATAGSAGAMLRAARQARGQDLELLAQVLKVPPRKLEALEADRYDELPGLAFVRGLALSYARQMGLDPQPVLGALPQAVTPPQQLEKVTRGLQTPYREGTGVPFSRGASGVLEWLKPAHVGAVLLLALALAFWFAPPMRSLFGDVSLRWPGSASQPAETAVTEALPAPAASGVVVTETPVLPASAVASEPVTPPVAPASVPAPAPISETVHSAPLPDPASSGPTVPAVAGTVVLRTTADSWIEARDAGGAVLLSRTVPAGETVGLDGKMPLRVRLGVASAVEVSLRGEPVDLKPFTRGTTATVVLK